ncbi:UDP-glucose--hexose-1-phosphate uridylyltransferase [Alteribacter populi]|uniref:UDP-glucose--hexose-1-phosphate uridylyltransferase n=1 Tax=Alteribacter populi TaxID=2011011 RepID=UPI0018E1DC86|nr:UDP-glucose--hexose-1-phosphate uridylyltransferase [Alteribacter populi]
MTINEKVQSLLNQAIDKELFDSQDEIYCRNRVLSLLQLDSFEFVKREGESVTIPDLLEDLAEDACARGIIDDVLDEKEIFATSLMDCLISKPSEINRTFYEKYDRDPQTATDYFYQLSQDSNYIQTKRIAKNIHNKVETDYGYLDITINLSKPEKDPKAIAKAKKAEGANYPKCLLCIENEGFQGRIGHPARANHRMIRMELEQEDWMLQYSPYVYYNEHCILLSTEHRDMKISEKTFARLLAFVEKVPHYFVGSNADIPIVGGSILSHDHYQGGNYKFAMAKAPEEHPFTLADYPNVTSAIVKWPMSVVRLRSENKEELVEASTHVLTRWKAYNDEESGIQSHFGEMPHNTVTPIARIRRGAFEIDIVLRNNRTNDEHPSGIFHPHEDVHHIKKENIGLIEVMGLAVLPPRLKDELEEIEDYLLRGEGAQVKEYHQPWAAGLRQRYEGMVTENNVSEIVNNEVGKKFVKVLEDAGVFKRTPEGRGAFKRFVHSL